MFKNPDSLLSKFFGLYKITIENKTELYLFVTEDMIGIDKMSVNHMFDLKGSTFKRFTHITEQ